MLKWAVTKRTESQQLIDPITGELNLHATNNVLNRAAILSRKSTARHSLGALQQQQQQQSSSSSSSTTVTTPTNIQRTTVNTNHIKEFNRRKSLGALQYSAVTSSSSSSSSDVTTSTTTTINTTTTILTSSPLSNIRIATKRKLKHGKENIIECTPHPITSRTIRLRRSSSGNAEHEKQTQHPLRDVGNNKNIASKKRTYSCSSLTTIITPRSKQRQSIEKNIFKRTLKKVPETPPPTQKIPDHINYATTLPTLDLEYSPCQGKSGPFLGLRGLTVGDSYYNNPCYFRDDIIAEPVTKRLKFSPGPGSSASTTTTTTTTTATTSSENIMSSTLNRRLSSLRFSKMSFKKSDIKNQKFSSKNHPSSSSSSLLSGSTTTSLSLTNINQILNSSSNENSLSSSAMNDTELDRMIEAILESARKERNEPMHKKNERRRNTTTQQNRNGYLSNNIYENDNNNNNKYDGLSTYTAAVDPASDLNKFYNNFHISPNKVMAVGETTIIVSDQFVNEREVKTPDNDDQEINKTKDEDDEDADAYTDAFEQKENEDKLDALLQLNSSKCFLRRQRAVRRKNKIDCTKSLDRRRSSLSSCRNRSSYFARDAKLSSSPKTPSTCTNTSYFRKSIDHLFAMNTPSLIEPNIKKQQPIIEAINQQLINQLTTTTIIDNKESSSSSSSSMLSKKLNENNSGIESNGIQACSTPTTGNNTSNISRTINNETNFNVNTQQSIIESNLSNTRRCLTYTTNNMNDDYDDDDDDIVHNVVINDNDNDNHNDDDDDDENEDDNNLPPNFFEETLEKRKSLATSTVPTNNPLFNSNNNIYARNRFSAAAATAPTQITTSIVNGSLDLAIFAKNKKIHIHVIRCRDLFRSNGDTINAYVKVALLPSNKANGFQRTAVQRDSIRPFFDHRFIFDLNDDYLTKCIQLSVWHRDRENKRSEFLGCMSIPVKSVINKEEVNGSYKLQPQSCLSAPIESISTMGDNSRASVDETISLDDFIVGGGGLGGGGTATNSNGTFGNCFGLGNNHHNSNSYATTTTTNNHHSTIQLSRKAIHQRDADENLFLRFLELDPVLDQTTTTTTTGTTNTTTTNTTTLFSSSSTIGINPTKNGDRKQSTVNLLTQPPKSSAQLGRTPFTITKQLHRTPDKGFGFSIVWTHPPRIEKIEPGLSADKVGIYPGDYVIFVEKQNIVTMPEIDILNLIRSQGNTLLLEIFRRNPTTNNLASNRGSNSNVDSLGNNGNNGNNGYNNINNNGVGGNRSVCTTNGIKSRVPSLTISNTNDDNQYPVQSQQQSHQHSSRPQQMSSCLMVGQRPSTACSNMSNSIETSKRRLNLPQVTFSKESIAGQHILDDPQKRYLYQLISKEQHFVNALQFGIQRFTTALQERRDIISINDHRTLFQNIEEILRLSEDILDQLVQDDQDPHINFASRVYLSKSTSFCAAYKKYCNGIKRADCVLVNKSRNANSEFMNFIAEPQVPKKRPDLITFIHRPLQHFREVLKLILMITSHCRPDSEEYRNFTKIISEYQATYRQITVGEGLMEPIGEGRLLLTLQDLESRLVFTKCKPFVLATKGRQWIFGGDLSRVEGRSIKPYWTLLFSDILLFAKVSRDRVLFITEEPLPLSNIIDSCFNVRKRTSEFRITFDPNAKTVESPTVHCAPDLTRTPRRNQRKRIIVLRAPSPELKAVWQNLLQRQIFLVNTTLGSTVSSPLDSPDILQTFVPLCEVSAAANSMASIKLSSGESINLRTLNGSNNNNHNNNNNNSQLQSHQQQQQQLTKMSKQIDEIIDEKCRFLNKTGTSKGNALHLAQWMKGQLDATACKTESIGSNHNHIEENGYDDEQLEEWTEDQLLKRTKELQLINEIGSYRATEAGMKRSNSQELTLNEIEAESKSASRSTTSDSQITVRSSPIANTTDKISICRHCHKNCKQKLAITNNVAHSINVPPSHQSLQVQNDQQLSSSSSPPSSSTLSSLTTNNNGCCQSSHNIMNSSGASTNSQQSIASSTTVTGGCLSQISQLTENTSKNSLKNINTDDATDDDDDNKQSNNDRINSNDQILQSNHNRNISDLRKKFFAEQPNNKTSIPLCFCKRNKNNTDLNDQQQQQQQLEQNPLISKEICKIVNSVDELQFTENCQEKLLQQNPLSCTCKLINFDDNLTENSIDSISTATTCNTTTNGTISNITVDDDDDIDGLIGRRDSNGNSIDEQIDDQLCDNDWINMMRKNLQKTQLDPFEVLPTISIVPPTPDKNTMITNKFITKSTFTWSTSSDNTKLNLDKTSSTCSDDKTKVNSFDISPEDSPIDDEPPPYRALTTSLKRYGTMSSLERLPSDDIEEKTYNSSEEDNADEDDEDDNDDVDENSRIIGKSNDVESRICNSHNTNSTDEDQNDDDIKIITREVYGDKNQSIRNWTVRAGSFMAEKMAFLEQSRAFLDNYLGRWDRSDYQNDTVEEENLEDCTSGATSNDDVWGTPTSGENDEIQMFNSDQTHSSPTKSSSSLTGDDDTELMMDELLMAPPMTASSIRGLLPRRRLEPLFEEDTESGEDSDDEDKLPPDCSSSDQGQARKIYTTNGRDLNSRISPDYVAEMKAEPYQRTTSIAADTTTPMPTWMTTKTRTTSAVTTVTTVLEEILPPAIDLISDKSSGKDADIYLAPVPTTGDLINQCVVVDEQSSHSTSSNNSISSMNMNMNHNNINNLDYGNIINNIINNNNNNNHVQHLDYQQVEEMQQQIQQQHQQTQQQQQQQQQAQVRLSPRLEMRLALNNDIMGDEDLINYEPGPDLATILGRDLSTYHRFTGRDLISRTASRVGPKEAHISFSQQRNSKMDTPTPNRKKPNQNTWNSSVSVDLVGNGNKQKLTDLERLAKQEKMYCTSQLKSGQVVNPFINRVKKSISTTTVLHDTSSKNISKTNKILNFLSRRNSEVQLSGMYSKESINDVPSINSNNNSNNASNEQLFSSSPRNDPDKPLDRRFWKQLSKRRRSSSVSEIEFS